MSTTARKTASSRPSPLSGAGGAERAPPKPARNSRGMPLTPTPPPLDRTGALPPGRAVGSFVLRELVERDDFTLGYRAASSVSDAEVLIEEYWPSALVERSLNGEPVLRDTGLAALFDAGLAAFVDEAEQLARIDDPALLKFGPVWRVHGTACRLRMDAPMRRAGRSLAERAPASDEASLRALAEPLLAALDAVHRAGRVHGNLRPGNIVLREDGSPLLLDFGAAAAAIARHAPWRAPQAEPAFAAPELHLYGRVPTPAADLYSLASLLWLFSTGELPEKPSAGPAIEPRWAAVKRRHPSLRVGAEWLQALDAALAFDAEARPQSVEAFRRLLIEPPRPAAVPVWREAPTTAFFAAPEAAAAPQPFGPFPPMRAVDDDDREPTWQLGDFAPVPEPSRAVAAPWPTVSRPALLDAPVEPTLARDGPARSPAPAAKSRHWPWALGGALVGGAAMLVFGLGWERIATTPALDSLVQLAITAPSVASSVAPSVAPSPAPAVAPPLPVEPTSAGRAMAQGEASAVVAAPAAPSAVAPVEAVPVREPPSRVGAEPPRKTPAPRAVAPAEADPASACAPRSNFALYNCMKTQCERTAWYAHPQCVQLRREDER